MENTRGMKIFSMLFGAVLGFSATSRAESVYSFGGACRSQGPWTQEALTSLQRLREVTLNLKNDDRCKAFGTALQAQFQSLQNEITQVDDTPQNIRRMSEIPKEMNALRSFLTSDVGMKSQVLDLMMNRTIEKATISAEMNSKMSSAASLMSSGVSSQAVAAHLSSLGQRLNAASNAGVKILNSVVSKLPQVLDECVASPDFAGQLVASSAQIMASLITGNENAGVGLAESISKISSMLRDRRFTKVVGRLNQQEFMTSMACLMEVTSEAYCSARDNMILIRQEQKRIQLVNNEKNQTVLDRIRSDREAENPLAGYYVLTQYVPVITNWLQKIIIGIDPQLPTEAQFQIKIVKEVSYDFIWAIKNLQGEYNKGLNTIRSYSSHEAQRNEVFNLLIKVAGLITTTENNQQNFFLVSKIPLHIPFYLIGIPPDAIPKEVKGTDLGTKMSFDEWVQREIDNLPVFKNPIQAAELIGYNMNKLIAEATLNSIAYYNRWFIVDKAAIINNSVTNITYSVIDSLQAIDGYLTALLDRIDTYKGDYTVVPSILDTQSRVRRILEGYDKARSLGRDVRKISPNQLSVEQIEGITKTYTDLVATVYDQLMVMLARTSFLSNRLNDYVYLDYIMMVKNNVNFNNYSQELFYATGREAFERLIQSYSGNPSSVVSDLNMALETHKANIEGMEFLFKDHMIRYLNYLTNKAAGKPQEKVSVTKDAFRDATDVVPLDLINIPAVWLARSWVFGASWWYRTFKYQDQYAGVGIPGQVSSPDTEFKSAEFLKSQLCVQGLAFSKTEDLAKYCRGTVLKSPYERPAKAGQAQNYYDDYLSVNFDAKLSEKKENKAENHSVRICAYRDYHRRNHIMFLTLGLNSNGQRK